MNPWLLISIFLHSAGLLAFGGGLLWFVLILGRADRVHGPDGSRIGDDLFRVTSLGMSMGLTLLIFGGLLRYYLLHQAFAWGAGSLADTLNLLKILLFLAQWIAWGWFEVVILHDFRRNMPAPDAPLEPSYAAARIRMRRALKLQLALFGIILLVSAGAQAARQS